MKRRDFIKKGVGAGIIAGSSFSLAGIDRLFAGQPNQTRAGSVDLVAVRGGEPEVMFDRGMEAMGGMRRFVKQGQTVVVKPNIGWDVSPERAANTNPGLVKRIVQHCFQAGARDVFVFDNTCDNWIRCYKNSGIEDAVREAGGKMMPGNTENFYRDVKIQNGKRLRDAKVHDLILDCDVFINVPVLKHHASARVTIAMKNLMGIVWDRRFWHRNDLHQCIADFAAFRKPDLNVIDAYRVMMKNGPRGVSVDDVVTMKSLIISPDMVAADAASARLFGSEPADIGHIRIGDEMGVGVMDLNKLRIERIVV